jgi:hypothetical protein
MGATLIGVFFYLDGHHIVKNTAVVKWKKFRRLNKLVSTNYKGCFKIIWVSICMIFQALWINILQYLNSTIVQIDKKTYEVTYIIRGKTYKMIVKSRRGPRKVLLVSDENQEDVSYIIFPYLGPEENFHGEKYTPKFFEKKELIFELSTGVEKIFQENEEIII